MKAEPIGLVDRNTNALSKSTRRRPHGASCQSSAEVLKGPDQPCQERAADESPKSQASINFPTMLGDNIRMVRDCASRRNAGSQ